MHFFCLSSWRRAERNSILDCQFQRIQLLLVGRSWTNTFPVSFNTFSSFHIFQSSSKWWWRKNQKQNMSTRKKPNRDLLSLRSKTKHQFKPHQTMCPIPLMFSTFYAATASNYFGANAFDRLKSASVPFMLVSVNSIYHHWNWTTNRTNILYKMVKWIACIDINQ